MAEENGAAIGALKELLRVKDKSIQRLGRQYAEVSERVKTLEAEREAAVRARDEATAAAAKAAQDFDATPLKAEAERLRGELRERDHRAVFDRLAKDRGVADDARELLYRHSGYKAEADAPDETKIAALIDGLKDQPGVARLFGEPAPASPPLPPGSGQGRRDTSGGKFRVTADQLKDGAWCMANADRLKQARREGTFEIVS